MMKALLLLAFGGPRSLDEVESFLTRLMRGRKPSPEQLERVKDRYRLIGVSSPLLEITWGQARGLEKKLNEKGYPFKSYVGMRYGHRCFIDTKTTRWPVSCARPRRRAFAGSTFKPPDGVGARRTPTIIRYLTVSAPTETAWI